METKVAIISIIVENAASAPIDALNALLHEYSRYVIGRMGVPYRQKNISIISVALDAPADRINALAGKLGRLPGISAKALYSAN